MRDSKYGECAFPLLKRRLVCFNELTSGVFFFILEDINPFCEAAVLDFTKCMNRKSRSKEF